MARGYARGATVDMRTLVFIPTYNERGNVEAMHQQIRALGLDVDILFVDDNSPDGTGQLLEEIARRDRRLHVVHRSGKLGIGSAHVDGIAWSYDHGFDVLITMDSDFSHSPSDIVRLLDRQHEAEIVVGSRYMNPGSLPGWNLLRRFLTSMGHALTRGLLRMNEDATGGFRLYNLKAIPRPLWERIGSRGYSFFFESLFVLKANGLSIAEIPIVLPARTYGSSKMSLFEAARSARRVMSLFVRNAVDPGRFRLDGPSSSLAIPPESDGSAALLARFVAIAGGALAIAFAVATPPFEVPDEPAHFFRVVAASEGHFLTVRRGEAYGQDLPRWAVDSAAASLDSIPGNISRKVSPDWLFQRHPSARSITGRVFVEIPKSPRVEKLGYTAASYSLLPYLLPAVAVRAALPLGLSPMGILVMVRLINAGLALAIAALAVRLSGPAAPLIALTATLPMAVLLRSSASADGLTMSVALLATALTIRFECDRSPREVGTFSPAIVSFLICLTKPNLPLALLPLTVSHHHLRRPNAFRLAIVAAVAGGLAVASIWGGDAARAAPGMAAGAASQMSSIASHPAAFLIVLARTWNEYSPRYLAEMIGKFGWLDTYLPGPLIVVAYALLLYSSLVWGPRYTAGRRMLIWAFASAAVLLVVVTLQLTWNAAGNRIVDGVQGRYFLPILPLLLLPMISERFRRTPDRASLVSLCACQSVILLGSLLILIRRFYP